MADENGSVRDERESQLGQARDAFMLAVDEFKTALEKYDYLGHEGLATLPQSRLAYSDRTALLMARFSDLAYIKFEDDRSGGPQELEMKLASGGFKILATFNAKDTQGFLAKGSEFAVLAFRGTEGNIKDIATDLNIRFYKAKAGKTHMGFAQAFTAVEKDVLEAVDNLGSTPFFVTGHSLGGALATIATSKLKRSNLSACYTYGSPRVGNPEFDSDLIKVPVYRVVNSSDAVTRVPLMTMNFQHVGDLRYFTRDGQLLRNPNIVQRAKRLIGNFLTHPFSPGTDHFISSYIGKLEGTAEARRKLPG